MYHYSLQIRVGYYIHIALKNKTHTVSEGDFTTIYLSRIFSHFQSF